MDVPYKPTNPIQPYQQIYYYNFVDTNDFLSLKEGIQAIFGNILGVSSLDVVVNEYGIYPPASPFYGNKKIASPTLIDKFQTINYVRKVLFLNIEKQFLSLQKKWGLQNPRFKNPIKLFPNELDFDSFQVLTEEGKPRYYLLTYRYGLTTNTLRKIKAKVYGLEVYVTLDAYSSILVSLSYNHRPLDTNKVITQAYLIAPYTYDGLQDVAVAYLADYEKGLVAPYYLRMPLTAEQKKDAKQSVEDTISFPNQKGKIVVGGEEESEEIDSSVFVPACEMSRELKINKSTLKLTKNILLEIESKIPDKKIDLYLKDLNFVINKYEINTPIRLAHFLGQVLHESTLLSRTSERGKKDEDYKGFKGRGLIQLTFRRNYEHYGKHIGEDFISSLSNKEKLEKPPHAVISAGWYWSTLKGLNRYADSNDLIMITYLINGGFNGFDDRLNLTKKAIEALRNRFKSKNFDYQIDSFSSSGIYFNMKASFAWGMWHDPLLEKGKGITYSKSKSIEGYKRLISLYDQEEMLRPNNPKWYGILIDDVINFANNRLNILNNA